MATPLTYGSVFAGVGGFDLAADSLGMKGLWQVEIDKDCRRVLERHWPNTPRFSDITALTGSELSPVDVVLAGFPCQDVSVAGQHGGIRGQRSGTFFDLMRTIRVVGPRWIVLENVPGLLTQPEWMGSVLGELADSGYHAAWRVLDARFFGVPQLRRRVFIVGHLGEPWSAPAQVLFEPEGGSGTPASSGQEGTGDDAGAALGPGSSREVVAALTSNGVGTCGADDNQAQAGHLVVGSRFGSELARPLTAAVNGPHYDYDTENFVISDGVRRLTPIECERLQGFPDNWTLPLHDSPRYRVLGNAVAVPVVEWVLRRLRDLALAI